MCNFLYVARSSFEKKERENMPRIKNADRNQFRAVVFVFDWFNSNVLEYYAKDNRQ